VDLVEQAWHTLGRQLAASRRAAGLNQEQLATATGYSRSTIANAETGRQHVQRPFWVRCDAALGTGTALTRGYDDIAALTRRSRTMRAFTEAHTDWLTVIQLPGYAPDLNAVEGAWSVMKSGLGNHAATTLSQLEAMVRSRLRAIQHRPELINALLGQTGLTLDPPP
jgi:transcriptional regulator with XRE-family HTH domain